MGFSFLFFLPVRAELMDWKMLFFFFPNFCQSALLTELTRSSSCYKQQLEPLLKSSFIINNLVRELQTTEESGT